MLGKSKEKQQLLNVKKIVKRTIIKEIQLLRRYQIPGYGIDKYFNVVTTTTMNFNEVAIVCINLKHETEFKLCYEKANSYPVMFVEGLKYYCKVNQSWCFVETRIFESEVRLKIFVDISVVCHFHVPLYGEWIRRRTLNKARCAFL